LAFSRKLANLNAAVTLLWTYNFCLIIALRMTPAMAAGITDHIWDLEDIIFLRRLTHDKS
jgi:hypothetical protein